MKLLSVAMLLFLLASCATTSKIAVSPDDSVRVYCGVAKLITYSWDINPETEENRLDTLETIDLIRKHNASYLKLCK